MRGRQSKIFNREARKEADSHRDHFLNERKQDLLKDTSAKFLKKRVKKIFKKLPWTEKHSFMLLLQDTGAKKIIDYF